VIAPQPLEQAIEAYSTITGVTVLYERSAPSQTPSPGVSGTLSVEAALQALLVGTGLIARFTDARDAVLVPVPNLNQTTASPEPPPSDGPAMTLDTLRVEAPARRVSQWLYDQYASVVQADIQRAIRKSISTQHISYHVVLEVWITGSGKVDRTRLVGSTGRPQLDLALSRAVSATTVDQPPPLGLLQPISVEVRSRAGFS
jgi:TonB family protein